jgi:hypothetical protein
VRARLTIMGIDENELAWRLRHEGIRAGEIIAYRAWRVIDARWLRKGDNRLHSVYMRNYVWHPDEPASGDVRTDGIYAMQSDQGKNTDTMLTMGRCYSARSKSGARSWSTNGATARNSARSRAWTMATRSFWRNSAKSIGSIRLPGPSAFQA